MSLWIGESYDREMELKPFVRHLVWGTGCCASFARGILRSEIKGFSFFA